MTQKRFIRRGVSKFFFAPSVANIHAVTRAEITAATELTDEIADISGFQLENQAVPVPDMGSTFEKNIPGTDSAADSSITLYEDLLTEDLEELLTKGTEAFILIMRKGDKPATNTLGCFPVRVGSSGPEFSAGNDPARQMVSMTITEEPELDGPIPAAGP